MEILRLENINKYFENNHVLKDINISINKGDIFGILGLSGAGKSTLVRIINGLEKFNSGKIYFNNEEVVFDKEYKRKVAMIFQSFNLLDQRTALKNVMIAGEIVKDKDSKTKAMKYLELVGLKNKMNNYPSQLSGGEKQRVAIARSLMTNPDILLCDEATSALDPTTTKQILDLLKELNKTLGLTIIIIAHQMNVIESVCNRVAILSDSMVVETGELYDVFLNPRTDIGKKLIYSGHVNTRLSNHRLIKLVFDGNIDEPLVANIIQDCNILLSIVYADSKIVDDRVYGQLIIKCPHSASDHDKLIKYLEIKNIKYEEVLSDDLK